MKTAENIRNSYEKKRMQYQHISLTGCVFLLIMNIGLHSHLKEKTF